MLSKTEFDLLKSSQYCDNPSCECWNKVGGGNIKINSRAKGQVYCNGCRNIWVLTKGTMFFDLRTPIDKVIKVLQCLARDMGLNNTCRQENMNPDAPLFKTKYLRKSPAMAEGLTDKIRDYSINCVFQLLAP